MRYVGLFIKLALAVWIAAETVKSILEAAVDYRYHHSTHWFSPIESLTTLLIGCALWILLLNMPKLREKRFFKGCAIPLWATRVLSVSISTLCVISIFYSADLIFFYGGRDLAYGADSLGAFELGERIYQVAVHSGETSLATVSGRGYDDKRERTKEDEELNSVVAKVYGASSRQMAHRYVILAGHELDNLANYQAAEIYLNRALTIYRSKSDDERCIEVLSKLAYAQYELHENEVLNKTLDDAANIVRRSHSREQISVLLGGLFWLAKKEGLPEDAELFDRAMRS